jgi:hypothetical protein
MRAMNYPLSSGIRSTSREFFFKCLIVHFPAIARKKWGPRGFFPRPEAAGPALPAFCDQDRCPASGGSSLIPARLRLPSPPLAPVSQRPFHHLRLRSGSPFRDLLSHSWYPTSPGIPDALYARATPLRGLTLPGWVTCVCPAGRPDPFAGLFFLDSLLICAKVPHDFRALDDPGV